VVLDGEAEVAMHDAHVLGRLQLLLLLFDAVKAVTPDKYVLWKARRAAQ